MGYTYKAIFPAVLVPPPKPAFLAVFPARAALTYASTTALSAAVSILTVAPPVPSFLIAARASAGTVRDAWDLAAARTVAMLVVLRTEAAIVVEKEKIARSAMSEEREKGDFMVVVVPGEMLFKSEKGDGRIGLETYLSIYRKRK
jgi:hypothetical protein